MKSNSFNNVNSKPRVKLVDEVVPPKSKGGNEHASKNMEMPARMTGKSTLFKSQSLGRTNATESKVKMLSPKSAAMQDLKGSRHLKESGALDRKFPSRIDRPVVSSVVSSPKGDQRLTPRAESSKPSAMNNNREVKVIQDGKASALSRSMSSINRKSLEPQIISGVISIPAIVFTFFFGEGEGVNLLPLIFWFYFQVWHPSFSTRFCASNVLSYNVISNFIFL